MDDQEWDDQEVDNLIEQAKALLDIDRAKEALTLLHQAARLEPSSIRVLGNLSYAYLKLGDWKEALNYGNQTVLADPKEEWGHRLCSAALRCMGNHPESLRAAHEALRLDTENAYCLYILGRAQLASGFPGYAEGTAWKIVEADPEDTDGYELLADVNSAMGRWDRVEWCARKALDIDPQNTSALRSLAVAMTKQKRARKALPCYVQILQIDPTDKDAQRRIMAFVSDFPFWAPPLLIPIGWIIMMRLGMNGFAAFGASLGGVWLLTPFLFRFFPQALLYPQPACRKLPASHRAFILRTWQRNWRRNSFIVMFCTCVYIGAFAVIFLLIIARFL